MRSYEDYFKMGRECGLSVEDAGLNADIQCELTGQRKIFKETKDSFLLVVNKTWDIEKVLSEHKANGLDLVLQDGKAASHTYRG